MFPEACTSPLSRASVRGLGALLCAVAMGGLSATVVRADAPRTFTITPVHGTAHTGITASFSFTSSANDPCKTQHVNFTWDGAPWASALGTAPTIYSHTCVATINTTPPAGTGGGPHTITATGELGLDTASTTFVDDDPPAPAPTAAPTAVPTATPAPAGPSAPPSAAPSATPSPTPSSKPAPTALSHSAASPAAACAGCGASSGGPPGPRPSGPATLAVGLLGLTGLAISATPGVLRGRRPRTQPTTP